MKYDDSDILLLEPDSITKRGQRGAFDNFAIWRNHHWIAVVFKAVQNKVMAYLKDFNPLDIDNSVQNM